MQQGIVSSMKVQKQNQNQNQNNNMHSLYILMAVIGLVGLSMIFVNYILETHHHTMTMTLKQNNVCIHKK